MPAPEQILVGLQSIASQAKWLAGVWHVLTLGAILGVVGGWRPSRRVIGAAVALPLLSVSALAWFQGNPFNGAMFAALALALAILGLRLPATTTAQPRWWALALGIGMTAFGLVYPHFVDAVSWMEYLYAAPTGLVPCPTLSLVIGVALVADGLGSRAWALVLACTGLFYGIFGALRLGVTLDVGLILGASGLLARGLLQPRTGQCPRHDGPRSGASRATG